ncbi:MAG: type VI secretion system contractile sheath large subunit [Alphaproteobacteria bacterium]|nr:type VI secretion system contractile sheath large subunit [Alphaproteobacteria bacterium]
MADNNDKTKGTTTETTAVETQTTETSLVAAIIERGRMVRDPSDADQLALARRLLQEFTEQTASGDLTLADNPLTAIQNRIARIDQLISDQLNAIMHAPEFQRLESAWRGLHYLVSKTNTGTHLKIRLLPITKKELRRDLETAVEFDQSALFKKVYEEEYGTFGGSPYGVLVGDFEFSRETPDVATLEKVASVASAAHAPFIAAAGPGMFDMESFLELNVPRDMQLLFESSELIKWRALRKTEDARYVSLTLPHFLLRLPYGPETIPVDGLNFVEDVDGTDHSKYLWGNSAYALAERITNAFDQYRWCAAIRGVEGGGLVQGLPIHTFPSADGDIAVKCPTEMAITDRREKELNDLGFTTLCYSKGTDMAAFFGTPTVNEPKSYDTDEANANAFLSAQLQYILAASRFAHYLKAIMRDKVGSFMSRENVSNYLNRWIAQYVLLNDSAGQEAKARFPLREARVDVTEVPGRPGSYRAVVFLKPHFQLNELSVSIRLVAELPPPAA